jgi:ABC-type transport system involved in multi-copper enzyme maturation permease subunit
MARSKKKISPPLRWIGWVIFDLAFAYLIAASFLHHAMSRFDLYILLMGGIIFAISLLFSSVLPKSFYKKHSGFTRSLSVFAFIVLGAALVLALLVAAHSGAHLEYLENSKHVRHVKHVKALRWWTRSLEAFSVFFAFTPLAILLLEAGNGSSKNVELPKVRSGKH